MDHERRTAMRGSFLYDRVYGSLLARIREGVYPAGEKLPPEEELCRAFGVSAITLNKALSMLSEGGFIRRVPGRGTYVTAPGQGAKPASREPGQPFIGLVLEHVSTPFGLDMLYHMDRAAARAGFRLLARFSYGEQAKEAEELSFFRETGAAGILLMPSHGRYYSQTILRLYLEDFPLLLVDKKLSGISLPSVRTDNGAAAAGLVDALCRRGARRLAFVSALEEEVTSVLERCNGFRDGARAWELPEPRWFWIPFGRGMQNYTRNSPAEETLGAARVFFRENKGEVEAIAAAEYGFVPALMQAAEAEGVRLGRDMMLASIDWDELAPCGAPFPHMRQDEAAIAEKAVALLVNRIKGQPVPEEDYLIPALCRTGKYAPDKEG